MTAELREIQYLVLPDAEQPYLLARVRWPDVYQAISAVRPYWQDDPGLFDLPYAANSTRLSREEAERIATEWGARIPAEDQAQPKGPQLIRRMPSDWSMLSTAERRAWSIPAGKSTRRVPIAVFATFERPAQDVAPVSKPRRWRRRATEITAVAAAQLDEPYPEGSTPESQHLDLPEPREPADAPIGVTTADERPAVSDHSSDHAGSVVMSLTTGTWHVDPVTGDAASAAEDASPDAPAPLSLDLSAPATKRLRRGRQTEKADKAEKPARSASKTPPAVIDLTDAKESSGSTVDHA